MIELVVDGRHLPVRQKPLSFRFKNPILHKADGSVIYNLELPITPVTREVFGFVDRLESIGFANNTRLFGDLYVKGVPLGTVGLDVVSCSADSYQVSAGLNRGLLNYTVKDVGLRELLKPVEFPLPELAEDRFDLFTASATNSVDDLPFIMFPTRNINAFVDPGWPMSAPLKAANWIPNAFNLTPTLAIAPYIVYTPYYKVAYIIEQIAEQLGYSMRQNDLKTITELARLVVYSNNYQFMQGDYFPQSAENWRLGDFMPKMTVLEFLNTIETMFNAKLIPDPKRNEMRFILLDQYFDPKTSIELKVDRDAIREIDFQRKRSSFRFAFGIPNDQYFNDLVNEYRDGDYTFRGVVANEASLPAASSAKWGDVYQSAASGAFYSLSVENDTDPVWAFHSLNVLPAIIGSDESRESFEVSGSPTVSALIDYTPPGENIVCPVLQTPAVGSFYNGPPVDPGLRLIFYRGLAESTPNNYLYPFGSSDSRTLGGELIPGANYAIRWEGPEGLLEKFWPKRLNWMKKGVVPVTCTKQLTLLELSEWDWTAAYAIGSRNALSSIIEGEIRPNGTLDARLELLPL